MKRLRLFTVFHANLDFSALPDRDVPIVLERCYWPLLQWVERESVPIGIEMPARTLERIVREDPEWLKSFCRLREQGLVELVGSGLAQVVGPLVPCDINRANLRLGQERYRKFLGETPGTWFVHEQTVSRGFLALYREVGAERLVVEWNNPASRRPELRPLRFRPARLRLAGGRGLALLWNDSVVFGRLQRAAHAEIPLREYLEFVAAAHDPEEERLLCAYGGDLEIFDYRPGRSRAPEAESREMERLVRCLGALARDPRFAFRLPERVAAGLEPGPLVELASPADPMPCKKRPAYNPTRWAVSGRDGLGMNTRCHALHRVARAVSSAGAAVEDLRALVELWRSDLRTRATEEKLEDFQEGAARLRARLREKLERVLPALAPGEDLLLFHPGPGPWEGEIAQLDLLLRPGALPNGSAVVSADPPEALPPGSWQLEEQQLHRDGSLRRVRLVLAPRLAPGQRLGVRLLPGGGASTPAGARSLDVVRTPEVQAAFLPHRGGALHWLRFPRVAPAPLVGTLASGSYDEIAYAADFYSGHAIAFSESGAQVTDLGAACVARLVEDGPVRTVVEFRTPTPLGVWCKRYRLYADRPRLDLIQLLRLEEVRLRSLRVGIVTWLPESYERDSLAYFTVQGGAEVERFGLPPGVRVEHERSVSPLVSASGCLGATEGWLAAGDRSQSVGLVTDLARAALVPLLSFADVDGSWFLRVQFSAAETDETRACFFRGVRRFAFALLGSRAGAAPIRSSAAAIQGGLLYRTGDRVGITDGL